MLRKYFHCFFCKNFLNCTRKFRPYDDEPHFTNIEIKGTSLITENSSRCKKPMKLKKK